MLQRSDVDGVNGVAYAGRIRGLLLRATALGISLAAIASVGTAPPAVDAQAQPILGLAALIAGPAGVVRDTNDDGWPDQVAARIVVPANPTAGDIDAATNIAGRLGHETMALTLPLVVRDDAADAKSTAVAILVGRDNAFVKKLIAERTVDAPALTEGQGLVASVGNAGGFGAAIVVTGADDEGTRAAGTELAGRLPRLWSMTGITLGAVEEQTTGYLKTKGVSATGARVTWMIVDRDRRGIATVNVRAAVAGGDVARAQKALEDLHAAHRRGLEPRTLNFANAAETRVELAGGAKPVSAVVARAGYNSRTLTPPIDPDELASDSPGERGAAAPQAAAGPARTFDLANAYSIEGWFGDGYTDLIPDRTDATIVLGAGADTLGAANIAARLGLESTGITLPLTKEAAKVREPARETGPILVGRENAVTDQLAKIGKVRLDGLTAGEGLVQTIGRAFGNTTATVVTGGDAAGTDAAAAYLARRVPYVWDTRRGSPTLGDVSTELTRFLRAKSGAGQASQAVTELDNALRDARDQKVESIDVKLYLEQAEPALDAFLTERVSKAFSGAKVTVASQGITDPVSVFEDTLEVPWEVDEFRAKLKSDVLPKVAAGAKVEIEARLSESPEFRKTLADETRAALEKAGAVKPDVRIRSAYKQGYLWMTEEVIPALAGKGVKSVKVKVARFEPDLSKKFKFYEVPSRWLHELYPVDDILHRAIGLPLESFSLELVDPGADVYTVEAMDGAGKVVHKAVFSPKTVEREYLEKFPGWSRVTVTTGWLRASVNGTVVADARIATDPERFWDHYQGKILPRIYDNVMKVTDNRPMPDKQPFHRDLDVEVWMSEPDFRIGVDEEHVSSLESLHEDLYFVTLDFYDALGRTTVRRRLAAPGKIFPIIHPERRGEPGKVVVKYAGNASTKARLEVSWKTKDVEKPTKVTRDLTAIEGAPVRLVKAVVRGDRVVELGARVEPKDEKESARAADALDSLATLQKAGLFKTALSYAHVDRVAVTLGTGDAITERIVRSTGAWAPSPVHERGAKPETPLVAWDHIIGPEESEALVAKLAAYPEVAAYRAGRSYRGREISVLEITAPTGGELVSLAKATSWKPTIFITGRQHANEVSSTSHILRLAELLTNDPGYKAILKKVNVVLHPVENPDGAAMAYELQKLTPTHMLHAGRYSALGMDVQSQVGQADPLLPEALVRGRVWLDWLPDIYLNPHGYPSHEWVQQFAGYVPPGFRTYWSSRGWYTSVGSLRDPRYPEHARVAETIRENIVREVNGNADVRAMNLRHYARYRRWAYGFAPYTYNQEIYKDTAIYYSDPETGEPSGSRRAGVSRFGGGGGGRANMTAWPQVTYFNGGTEAPDETAQGAWLDLVTKPGFSYLMASVRYLQQGQYAVERIEEDGQRDSASRTWLRVRPVKPGRAPTAVETAAGK